MRLLQKIGKEIMKRCEKHINVDRVFSGFIISTKKNIDQSIKLVESYTVMTAIHYCTVQVLRGVEGGILPAGLLPQAELLRHAPVRRSRHLHTD